MHSARLLWSYLFYFIKFCNSNVSWSLFSFGKNILLFPMAVLCQPVMPLYTHHTILISLGSNTVFLLFSIVNTLICFGVLIYIALWCVLLPKFPYVYSAVFKICFCSLQVHFKFWIYFPEVNKHLLSETSSPASVNSKLNELTSKISLRILMKMLSSLYCWCWNH